MLRLVLAGAATAVVVSLGSVAMLFATAPEWLSLLVEPLSLLLLPGLLVGVLNAGPHDLDPDVVLAGTVVLYFLAFWLILEWRAWRIRRRNLPGSLRIHAKTAGPE